MTLLALPTCAELPDADPDDAFLHAALDEAGIAFELPRWDDPDVDWARYDLTLIRTTWDYAPRREEYIAWTERVPHLLNPAPIVAWNTDKRYLSEALAGGLPVVPTIFVAPGQRLPLLEAEVVVKPTVSAGSKDTQRFKHDETRAADNLVRTIHGSGRTVMVQPYVRSVDTRGETALLYFGGEFSHAIEKGPLLRRGAAPTNSLFAPEVIRPREPSERERAVADRAVAWLTERFGVVPTYARIDLVEGGRAGAEWPLILELELTEPSLFFEHSPGAAERLIAALPL